MIDLSVIIVNWNTKELLEKCLDSVFEQTTGIGFEVIVVDNGSTDGSIKQIQDLKIKNQNLFLIKNRQNLGFARANNQGIEIAKGKYVLLLNSDTKIIGNSLKDLFLFAERNKKAAVVGPLLLNSDGSRQPSTAPFLTLPAAAAWLFTGDRFVFTSPARETRVDWVMGSAMLVKKKAIEKVGALDENFFMYVEEQEWCYRLKKAGFEIWFYPGAEVFHLGRGSSPVSLSGARRSKKRAILGIYKGLLYFYQKHFAPWQVVVLKFLLRAKAGGAWLVGYLINSRYLKETYGEAFKLVR